MPPDWASLWAGRARFTVFDATFDAGAFAAVLRRWQDDPARPAQLHYIALVRDPLPGARRVPQAVAGVTLDLISATLEQALEQLEARIDVVVLGAIDQQGSRFAHALGRLASPGAALCVDSLTQAQVAALAHAGFAWDSGTPRRAVFASRRPQRAQPRPPGRRAIVLGAGLAGAAACERLCARGWQVTLVERHAEAAAEASGNLAGISMPLLARDDNLMARLSRAAFRYQLDYLDRFDGIDGARCGVLQLARDPAHADVQRAIAGARAYPADFAEWLEAPEAGALLGWPGSEGAWLFRQGGWLNPPSVCRALLAACGAGLTRHFGAGTSAVRRAGEDWQVHDEAGRLLAQAPVLILANGCGARDLAWSASLPLAAVRGQVTHLARGAAPALPFVLCREAYLTPAHQGLHSLGASYDDDADPLLRAASQHENLEKIRALCGAPGLGQDAPLLGRVGFRCVAPDRLPLVGALPDPDAAAGGRLERLRDVPRHPNLHGLLGYASRGLTWAPLAAELLAAQLEGEALPLETDLVQALDPARFLLRERRRRPARV